jgi:hypothetical protein
MIDWYMTTVLQLHHTSGLCLGALSLNHTGPSLLLIPSGKCRDRRTTDLVPIPVRLLHLN